MNPFYRRQIYEKGRKSILSYQKKKKKKKKIMDSFQVLIPVAPVGDKRVFFPKKKKKKKKNMEFQNHSDIVYWSKNYKKMSLILQFCLG